MKIDKFTIAVLKNFASINPSIVVREGNTLETNKKEYIIAKAKLDITFPKRFAFAELPKFISALEMFKEPELTFLDTNLVIHSNHQSVTLAYTNEELIKNNIAGKKVELPSVDAIASMNSDIIPQVMKALKFLALPQIAVWGDGETIFIGTAESKDTKKSTGNSYAVSLGHTDKVFRAIFNPENLVLYPDNYEIAICRRGVARFISERLEYYIAMEEKQSYFK